MISGMSALCCSLLLSSWLVLTVRKTKARYRSLAAGVRIRVECACPLTPDVAQSVPLLERMPMTMIEVIIFM
jgi:hypothetical protein